MSVTFFDRMTDRLGFTLTTSLPQHKEIWTSWFLASLLSATKQCSGKNGEGTHTLLEHTFIFNEITPRFIVLHWCLESIPFIGV